MSQAKISAIIPFKDRSKMTLDCVNSLLKYCPIIREVILVSNNSSDSELQKICEGVAGIPVAKVLLYNQPFNYQKINNWAVKHATGEYVLFLNNDTELVDMSKGVIEHMVKLASGNNVGMVGCILLYGDKRTIQHAGVYLRPGSLGDHIYIGKLYRMALKEGGTNSTYPYSIVHDRQVTAVTGAVQLISRGKFDEVNGFNEEFIIGGGDVDLCLRLLRTGYTTILSSKGYILHKESQSRSHLPITYSDFYHSYLSYIQNFDLKVGDPLSPEITKEMHDD